jgi:glucose-6-phosphate 1-dehydrogenase
VIDRILIFGGAGDLAGRYLLPALAELEQAGHLPERFRIVGVGRQEWRDEDYRRFAGTWLDQQGPHLDQGQREVLLHRLAWRQADATDAGSLRRLLGESIGPPVLYLALPPGVFAPFLDALEQADIAEGARLVVEKPFGTDLDSARDLNRRIAAMLDERSVFRVDHVLARQTVQNIVGLRFANRVFEPIWNHLHLAKVEIIWDEMLGLEGRAGYYDHAGALRDMLQNHLLQLLALVAMEPPAGLDEQDLRDRKVDVLRATRALSPAESDPPSVRARYTAGTVSGRRLPDYTDEDGVDPDRRTETFAEIRLAVDNWRWSGVEFVLRSGKALAIDRTEVALHFLPVPHSAFPDIEPPESNVLRLGLGPDRIGFELNLTTGGDPFALERGELSLGLAPQELSPYARLLLDIVDGDATLSIRGDEAEESWRIVTPVLESWQRGEVPLLTYPAGSDGPDVDR